MPSDWESEPLVDLGANFDLPPVEMASNSGFQRARRFRLAGAVIAVLLLASASALPAREPLVIAARITIGLDAKLMVQGSELFISDITGGHSEIRAYALESGRLRWSATTSELATEATMHFRDGAVIVSTAEFTSTGTNTEAFDAATGRSLWSSDLGDASVTSTGVLLDTPQPPDGQGDNSSALPPLELVDTRTGALRWSRPVDGACVSEMSNPSSGPGAALVELCADTSTLSLVDLSDGRTVASRQVALGDQIDEFILPPTDQMLAPQLVVLGDDVLVAHANAPVPTIDAYADSDLASLWSGLQLVDGLDVAVCGSALCAYVGSEGTVIDPISGKQTGTVPSPSSPQLADGALLLAPVGAHPTKRALDVMPSVRAGTVTPVPPTGAGDAWLEIWRPDGSPEPVELLHDVGTNACVHADGYLACSTSALQLSFWKAP
jgi:PQQ-like domain